MATARAVFAGEKPIWQSPYLGCQPAPTPLQSYLLGQRWCLGARALCWTASKPQLTPACAWSFSSQAQAILATIYLILRLGLLPPWAPSGPWWEGLIQLHPTPTPFETSLPQTPPPPDPKPASPSLPHFSNMFKCKKYMQIYEFTVKSFDFLIYFVTIYIFLYLLNVTKIQGTSDFRWLMYKFCENILSTNISQTPSCFSTLCVYFHICCKRSKHQWGHQPHDCVLPTRK